MNSQKHPTGGMRKHFDNSQVNRTTLEYTTTKSSMGELFTKETYLFSFGK